METKLTIHVNRGVIASATKYAKLHGVSLSALIEDYILALATSDELDVPRTPIQKQSTQVSPPQVPLEQMKRNLEDKFA